MRSGIPKEVLREKGKIAILKYTREERTSGQLMEFAEREGIWSRATFYRKMADLLNDPKHSIEKHPLDPSPGETVFYKTTKGGLEEIKNYEEYVNDGSITDSTQIPKISWLFKVEPPENQSILGRSLYEHYTKAFANPTVADQLRMIFSSIAYYFPNFLTDDSEYEGGTVQENTTYGGLVTPDGRFSFTILSEAVICGRSRMMISKALDR